MNMVQAQHCYSGIWYLDWKEATWPEKRKPLFSQRQLASLDYFLKLFFCSCQSVVRCTSPRMIECHDHRQDKCLMVWWIVICMTQTLFAFPETYFCNHCESRSYWERILSPVLYPGFLAIRVSNISHFHSGLYFSTMLGEEMHLHWNRKGALWLLNLSSHPQSLSEIGSNLRILKLNWENQG